MTRDRKEKELYEEEKRKLWIGVYMAYVGASNSINDDGAVRWADRAIKRFEERFKNRDHETDTNQS